MHDGLNETLFTHELLHEEEHRETVEDLIGELVDWRLLRDLRRNLRGDDSAGRQIEPSANGKQSATPMYSYDPL